MHASSFLRQDTILLVSYNPPFESRIKRINGFHGLFMMVLFCIDDARIVFSSEGSQSSIYLQILLFYHGL